MIHFKSNEDIIYIRKSAGLVSRTLGMLASEIKPGVTPLFLDKLAEEFMNLKWFGRGPHENYIDRKTSADIGIYESTVDDQYVPYIRPQENGYKIDTRWLTLTDENGTGILISGNPLICFAALRNIHDDFESPGKLSQYRKDAKSANTHTIDVKPRDFINLNVDMGQMGVGGMIHGVLKYILNIDCLMTKLFSSLAGTRIGTPPAMAKYTPNKKE
jgi:hypothetical protein